MKVEDKQDKPSRKKSKKSSSGNLLVGYYLISILTDVGFSDKPSKVNDEIIDQDHYAADNGDIYARSRKQRTSRPGMYN